MLYTFFFIGYACLDAQILFSGSVGASGGRGRADCHSGPVIGTQQDSAGCQTFILR